MTNSYEISVQISMPAPDNIREVEQRVDMAVSFSDGNWTRHTDYRCASHENQATVRYVTRKSGHLSASVDNELALCQWIVEAAREVEPRASVSIQMACVSGLDTLSYHAEIAPLF